MLSVKITLSQWFKAKGGELRTNITGDVLHIHAILDGQSLETRSSLSMRGVRSLEQAFSQVTGLQVEPVSNSAVGVTYNYIVGRSQGTVEEAFEAFARIMERVDDGMDQDGLAKKADLLRGTALEYMSGKKLDVVDLGGDMASQGLRLINGLQSDAKELVLTEATTDGALGLFVEMVSRFNKLPFRVEQKVTIESAEHDSSDLRRLLKLDYNGAFGDDYWVDSLGDMSMVSKTKNSKFATCFPRGTRTYDQFVDETVQNAKSNWELDAVVRMTGAKSCESFVIGKIIKSRGQFELTDDSIRFKGNDK